MKLLIVPALALCLHSGAARAQNQGFQLNRYEPTPAGEWSFAVSHPWYSKTRDFAAGFTLNYGHNPLVFGLRGADGSFTRQDVVIQHQLLGHFDFALSLWDRLTISATMPITFLERGQNIAGVGPIDGAAFGDPRLGLMVRLYGQPDADDFSISLGGDVWIPIGSDKERAGDSTARVLPKLVLGGLVRDHFRWSATGGFYFRPEATLGNLADTTGATIGPALQLGFLAQYANLEKRFAIGPEMIIHSTVTGGNAFKKDYTSLEMLLGGHYNIAGVLQTGLALGLGFLRDPGTPDFRLLFRLAYAPLAARQKQQLPPPVQQAPPPPVVQQPPPPPVVQQPPPPPKINPCKDAKVLIKEDRLEVREHILFQKGSAVIDPASYGLLMDIGDAIKFRPGVRRVSIEGHTDSDGSEALNQRLSENRANAVMQWLIYKAGIERIRLESHGFGEKRLKVTPEVTAADKEDNRRVEFRIIDPDPRVSPQHEGCVCKVTVRDDKLAISDQILFETGSAEIKRESYPLLQVVAETIKGHPEIRKLSVEGHTDTNGADDLNLRLSEERAESVRVWLTQRGDIDAAMLSSKGFGESKLKVRPERSKADKAQNRRVEFLILDRSTSGTEDPCGAT